MLDPHERELIHRPEPQSLVDDQMRRLLSSMNELMATDEFLQMVDNSAGLAARFYNKLTDLGIPREVAGSMAASYCQNLSSSKPGG